MTARRHKGVTRHPDIDGILSLLAEELGQILGPQLFGLYLTGSLTYGGFERGSSDIDFLAILSQSLGPQQFALIKRAHARIGAKYSIWSRRIEGSYITRDMLRHVEPPQPRPYINEGAFWDPDPVYGNEWLLNLHVLDECGVPLTGPEPKTFLPPIDIAALREASCRDLLDEWKPKLDDSRYLENSHHQAYAVLTLCRILYRARNENVASKRVAAAWVKQEYGERWRPLVERAERWQHGRKMNAIEETREFIRFTLAEVASRAGDVNRRRA